MDKEYRSLATEVNLDSVFIRRFGRILGYIFTDDPISPKLAGPVSAYLCLIAVSIVYEVNVFFLGNLTGEFYAALLDNSKDQFVHVVIKGTLLCVAQAFTKATKSFTSQWLGIRARQQLTVKLQRQYLDKNHLYYQLHEFATSAADNPDQRLSQDIESLTQILISLLDGLCISPILLVWYTFQTSQSAGWLGAFLVWLYFAVSGIFCKFVISPLSRRVYSKDQAEGNFRYQHVYIRDNSESLALTIDGHKTMQTLLDKSFGDIMHASWALVRYTWVVDAVTELFQYFGTVFTYIVIGIVILSFGESADSPKRSLPDLGQFISQSAFAIMYLVYQITAITAASEKMGRLAGYVARVSLFSEALALICDDSDDASVASEDQLCLHVDPMQFYRYPNAKKAAVLSPNSPVLLEIESLSIFRPYGSAIMLQNINLVVEQRQHTLIVGPSGVGKSTLVKCIAGLWPWCVAGSQINVSLTGPADTMILPQHPFLVPNGSLASQIVFPQSLEESDTSHERLVPLLKRVHLHNLLPHLEHVTIKEVLACYEPFSVTSLSKGEIQKLMLARLLYHKPKLAILDESFSGIDSQTVPILLQECMKTDMTILLISHGQVQGFSQILQLDKSSKVEVYGDTDKAVMQ